MVRRRVRKVKDPRKVPRSGRKLDLDKINRDQDFNTEFVKAVLYGESVKDVTKDESVLPVFVTRQGVHHFMEVKYNVNYLMKS